MMSRWNGSSYVRNRCTHSAATSRSIQTVVRRVHIDGGSLPGNVRALPDIGYHHVAVSAARPWAASRASLLSLILLGALVAIPFLLRLALLERRRFDPDELEHLHFAWSVAQGKVPYRDYFDHHTPWLHFLLSPLFSLYRVETSTADAAAVLFAARRVIWLLAGVALALTFALARHWRGHREAWAATLLLASTWVFLTKTLEVRPDVPATGLMVASLLLALGGWRRLAAARSGAAWRFLASGLGLGAAFLFTQKLLFLLPGVAAAEIVLLVSRHVAAPRSARWRCLAAQGVGFVVPVALTLGWFASRQALGAFFDCNFLVNARWPGLGPREFVLRFLGDDPAFGALAVLGFLRQVRTLARPQDVARGEPLLALAFLAPLLSLFVHPAVTFHYFLLFLPQAALYAGAALVWLADRAASGLARHRPRISPVAGAAALAALAVALSIHPLWRFARTFPAGNWNALQGIRYVLRNSAPWETTFDGFSGLGLFRPPAFYHPFQHWHTRAIQTEAERRHIVEALRTGAVLPKLVFWDGYLRDGVPAEAAPFIETHYVPVGPDPVRVRAFDNGLGWWSDEGPRFLGWVRGQERAPHVLCGEGWRDPGVVDGVPARRTRTRSAELVVPIRDPGDFHVAVKARADAHALPFDLELMAGGVSAGRSPAAAGWRAYAFLVRGRDLRSGLNDFTLRLRATPHSPPGRPELAVETIALHRARTVLTPAPAGP
jgi:hypothetical protein